MLLVHEMPTQFSAADFSGDGTVKPSALLHRFQDVASRHVETLGAGFDDLRKRGLIWVLTGLRLRVEREPVPDTAYRLVTCPRPDGSRMFQRDFYLLDGEEVLVRAASLWCVVSFETRQVVQAGLVFPGEYYEKDAFPERIRRLRPGKLEPVSRYTVRSSDLDGNDHMNNCRYADLALEALGTPDVRELTVSFVRETRLGDQLTLSVSEDRRTAAGSLPDGTPVFAVQVS